MMDLRVRIAIAGLLAGALSGVVLAQADAGAAAAGATAARESAATLDRQLDWSRARLIAVQDGGRYKTLESFAREWMTNMTGKQHLPELSPLASLFEWLFNRNAYFDEPLIYIKDRGLRLHFGAHLPEAARQRVLARGLMTLREFTSPMVEQRMRELNPRFDMRPAMNRVSETRAAATMLEQNVRLVPQPGEDPLAPWFTLRELFANTPTLCRALGIAEREVQEITGRVAPIAGISEADAEELVRRWVLELRPAWLARDAAGTQAALDRLATRLPGLASASVYPSLAQRQAEIRYHGMGKFGWGILAYVAGLVLAIWAMVTRWRWPAVGSQILLLGALTYHAYVIGLRWYILGRIPVANMFEAVTASAWVCIALVIVIELLRVAGQTGLLRTMAATWRFHAPLAVIIAGAATWAAERALNRGGLPFDWLYVTLVGLTPIVAFFGVYALVALKAMLPRLFYRPTGATVFMLGAHATGFFALVTASFILPAHHANLSSIRAILDDVMLRIHTVMIIASYALIFLAGVIALAYLFGYYASTAPVKSREVGLIVAWGGLLMTLYAIGPHPAFAAFVPDANQMNGWTQAAWTAPVFLTLAGACVLGLALLQIFPGGPAALRFYAQTALLVAFVVGLSLATTPRGFPQYLGYIMVIGGLVWAGGNMLAAWRASRATPEYAAAELEFSPLAISVAAAGPGAAAALARPILAGGAPGDERNRRVPAWLQHLDWSHLIILNMVFIFLFVGIILGAVWADYSWGRPWGWDPKEVFAMNTWLIYAILIHARFVARERGLWTAWLSVAGCLMMAFNWCYVNFFIVGLHSYA